MKKIFSTFMVILLLVATIFCVFDIQHAKADETVYIRADGSVDGTAYIQTADDITYLFTANISDSLVVEKSNIILNGNGYTLQGAGTGTGIDLFGQTNVTVQNLQIEAFDCGIFLSSSSNNTILENNISNDNDGIALSSSSGNVIIENNVTENQDNGITLALSSDNSVIENNVAGSFADIGVYLSSNNIISGNNVADSSFSGIYLYNSDHNSISLNNVTPNNWCGIRIESNSDYNRISRNNVAANNGMGIFLYRSSNNTLTDNTMTNACTLGYDFGVDGSSLSDFMNDVDTSNTVEGKPVYYWIERQDMTVPQDAGTVILINCANITVQDLNLTRNRQGILLANTSNSEILENNISDNCFGFLMWGSSGNIVYHNDLFYNSRQTHDDSPSMNAWDDGYPQGGNYWSDYKGRDLYSGQYQNLTGSDGIGDTPYLLEANGTDNYPLLKPWSTAGAIGGFIHVYLT